MHRSCHEFNKESDSCIRKFISTVFQCVSHLHPNNCVNEEQHDDQEGNVRQCLERLDESPQKCSNALASTEQLHQSHDTKESEEVYRYDARRLGHVAVDVGFHVDLRVHDVNETSEYDDKVENVPSITKVVFEAECGQFENKLERKNSREYHVKNVEGFAVEFRLPVEFHRQRDCIDHD